MGSDPFVFPRGEGLDEITPELETRTVNLMGAVASGDYSVLGCGK